MKIPVRLVNGSESSEGRVEVYYKGNWGSICDDTFDDKDATVVCRSLGYLNGTTEGNKAPKWFGQGLRYAIYGIHCKGYERSIYQCDITRYHGGCGGENGNEHSGVQCQELAATGSLSRPLGNPQSQGSPLGDDTMATTGSPLTKPDQLTRGPGPM